MGSACFEVRADPLISGLGFGGVAGVEELENAVDLCHLHERLEAVVYTDEEEFAIVALGADVIVHDDAEAG